MKISRSFWKTIRVLIVLLLIIGIAIQFVRPPLENPAVTGDLNAPADAKAILRRACYDCHSNETRLAWFDEPAPAYWLVVKDVKAGRAVLNFSNWDSLPKGQQAAKIFESVMQIEQQGMPLSQYALLHHGAAISAEELEVLKKYALTLAYKARPDTVRQRAAGEQYAQFVGGAGSPAVQDEYNGVAYSAVAGWQNWQPVSTTERYDNGTLRVILGNAVTIKAIREGHTNPYPDGAIFAKAAYAQLPDTAGEIHAGAFLQVEFMIRDSKKYDATFGWGWARWVGGLALKPYGRDASFVTECVNCHRPLDKTDHTFTFPMSDIFRPYGQSGEAPDTSLLSSGRVITSFVSPGEKAMAVLYGNEAAVTSARRGLPYGPGAVLTLIRWHQQDDHHWFGGRIPGSIASEEVVRFGAGEKPIYTIYGDPGLKKLDMDSAVIAKRLLYITGKKASVVPRP